MEKKTAMSETRKKEPGFEKSIARLEEIVRALDDGSAPLDESLKLFEEGVGLVRACTEKLDSAEQKVKILTGGTEKNFIPADQ